MAGMAKRGSPVSSSSLRDAVAARRGGRSGRAHLPWSTGPVEGHIHRLKLIKRQMYGRAKLDLPRIRVLHAA